MWKTVVVVVMLLSRIAAADPELDTPLFNCKKSAAKVEVSFKSELELKELLTWVVGFTCKEFVLDPRIVTLGRKVMLIAPNAISSADAYKLFVTALSTIGLTVVPKGKVMRIVESAAGRRDTPTIYRSGMPGDTDEVVRYVMQPQYAQAETLNKLFAAMKSDAGDVQVVGSLIMITDYAGNVRDMMSVAKMVDVANGEGIYTIPVIHSVAKQLSDEITPLLGANPPKLIVDERTNTLMFTAAPATYDRVKALVDRLDISLQIEGGASIHVYQLDHAIADELAKTLNDAIQQQGSAKTAGPGAKVADALGTVLEGQARVISDKPTNKVIVMSSGRDFLAIREVIKELDVPRRQVYIEAMIVEVQIGSGLDIGTSFHSAKTNDDGSAIAVGGFQAPNFKSTDLTSLASATGLIGGLIGETLPGSKTLLGKSIPSFAVLFQALANSSRTHVISTPNMLALDNEETKYKVGNNIPYKKGVMPTSATNTSLSTNINRQDLLLEFAIKPHISSNDMVLLEIKHEAKDLGDMVADLGPSWSTRSFETRALVRDQQTVVFGGLMQERDYVLNTQVPILGSLPILGYLFKYTTRSKKKTQLILMLTPYIIKDQLDIETIRQRKVREYDELVGSYRFLDNARYLPRVDYGRKRGVVEEINRAVLDVEAETAARASLREPVRVSPGLVEPATASRNAAK